jgi:hypothetical protein
MIGDACVLFVSLALFVYFAGNQVTSLSVLELINREMHVISAKNRRSALANGGKRGSKAALRK